MFIWLRRRLNYVYVKKTVDCKFSAQILNRYLKTTTGKNIAWQGTALPASASESSGLSLNKHKHSQETQSPRLLLSDRPHQWSHYPRAETKQNLVTHVTHLLPQSSHTEIISCLLTDWLIKIPKGLAFISFHFFVLFSFFLNKLPGLTTVLHLYDQTLESAGGFREHCFPSALPLITRQ